MLKNNCCSLKQFIEKSGGSHTLKFREAAQHRRGAIHHVLLFLRLLLLIQFLLLPSLQFVFLILLLFQ